MIKRSRLWLPGVVLVGLLALLVFKVPQAQAYEMPNPGDFSGGNNIYAEIAIANDVTNTLNAPEVSAKFYYNPGQPKTVDIFDGCHSLGDNFQGFYEHDADPRSPFPRAPNYSDNCDSEPGRVTFFDFYALDSNGNPKRGVPDVRLNGQNMFRNWWSSFDLSGLDSDISVLSNKVEVLMVARFMDPVAATGYINAFRLGTSSPGAFIGYASDRDFAMQRRADRHWPPGRPGYYYDENYALRFSQPCNDLSSRSRIIRWRDADAGAAGIPQDWNVSFSLEKAPKTSPGAWQPVGFDVFAGIPGFSGIPMGSYGGFLNDETVIGGNGGSGLASDRFLQFVSEPGWNYRWSWNGIEENNGILANIPFDSGLAEVAQCGVTGNVDGTGISNCDNLVGWAFDTQKTEALLEVHAYFDGQPTPMVFTPHWQPLPATRSGSPAPGPAPPGQYIVNQRPDVAAAYPGAGDWHGFEIPASQYAAAINLNNGAVHTVDLYAISASGGPPRRLSSTPVEIGPCVRPLCSTPAITLLPPNPEPGQPFSVVVGYRTDPPTTAPQPFDVTINFPGVTNGNQTSGPRTSPPTSFQFDNLIDTRPGEHSSPSLWTVGIGRGSGRRTVTCPGQYTIGSKPYLKVFGNDIQAGGNMSTAPKELNCSAPISNRSSIVTYSVLDPSGRYKGAGVQFAASALGKIFEFPSATHNPAASNLANAPKSLSLANTAAGLPFGGLSNNWTCVPDYLADYLNDNPGAVPETVSNLTIPASYDGSHYIKPAGGVLVINNGNIGRGRRVVIYVDGDVRLDNRIQFVGGGYGSTDEIPYFQLVAKGNIFITNGVQELDGVYVAQGDDPQGVILTCAQAVGGGAASYTGELLYAQCNSQLKINGSFMARQIKFMRTKGSLNLSSVDEPRTSSNIAEIFNFTPEIYLAKPPDSLLLECALNCTYKSITSLPPIL